jgi:hypothetical protein
MKLRTYQVFITALIIASLFFLTGCDDEQTSQSSFIDHYNEYCGYAYKGETTYLDLGDDSFDGADLTMILESCSEDEVRIPFIVDEDSSRTWIVQMTDNGLHLSHDHRYPDGTEYDQNMYGGYADDKGTEFLQYFPADERTIEERPQREINRWAKEFDLENERYYYRLYLRDELRFEAAFDLSNPVAL